MKKLLILLSFIGALAFFTPKSATALPPGQSDCYTAILDCMDGTSHIVVICDPTDWSAWGQLLCDYAAD